MALNQRGGLTGTNVMNTMDAIKANQKKMQLRSIQELWNQYQRNKRAEGLEAESLGELYRAGGSKIGGGAGTLGGMLLEDKWGTDSENNWWSPLVKPAASLLGSGVGLLAGRYLSPEIPELSYEDFKIKEGINIGDSKYHRGLKSGLETIAESDVEAYDTKIDSLTTGDNLADILTAFSDMAFFSELTNEDWLDNILAIFGEEDQPVESASKPRKPTWIPGEGITSV